MGSESTKKKKVKKRLKPKLITSTYLTKLTDGFTGAEIKAVVSRAVGFMLKRLYVVVSIGDDVDTDYEKKYPDVCRLTMNDFRKAIDDVKKNRGPDNKPPLGIYT